MNIELIRTATLKPLERNARTHTPEQIEKVAKSIKEFGFRNPILITDDLDVVSGNCRLEAAKKLGVKKVPCIRLSGLTPEQVRAYAIADNKLALEAGWDLEMLQQELAYLKEIPGFDFDTIGFSENEINEMFLPPNDSFKEFEDNGEMEYVNEDQEPFRQILVSFKCEADVAEFAKRLGLPMTARTRATWFPYVPQEKEHEMHDPNG